MVIIMSIKIKAEDIIAIAKEKGERFEHKEGNIKTGYVIKDKKTGNEFVWVPVEKNQKITETLKNQVSANKISFLL